MNGTPNLVLPACDKLRARQRERLAVVYVRQSTMNQVHHHRESTAAQYALTELARRLGWSPDRVVLIDEDLGLSGSSAEHRPGFQRLLSEVALDHVGVIIGIEMSRLARSCKDWHQLLELCAIFGTFICDLDGLYDPSIYNDRLLLGLKGTLSEAELHLIRQRMLQGSQQKASRGELVTRLPIGYLRDTEGRVQLDPDEQVRGVIGTIFDLFERVGTVSGVLKRLHDAGVQIGVRLEGGAQRGQLAWRRPNQTTVKNILSHPIYAGAYVYGRRGRRPGVGSRFWKPSDQWQILLKDRMPAYIPWNRYEANVQQLRENRSSRQNKGVVRRGRALLCGLLICGRCGYRLTTRYAGTASTPRYCCTARAVYGEPACQSLKSQPLDDEVARLVMIALQPAAVEVSLHVARDLQAQREAAERTWQQRLERAAYEADRARRQFDAVEPENRLVARTLEAQWEQKLATHRALFDEHERACQSQPSLLTEPEQQEIRALATDLPALWHATSTTDGDRKAILRQVIDRIVVNGEQDTEWVEARIHWAGGQQTYTRLRRPVARIEQLSDFALIRETIVGLRRQRQRIPAIVARLNELGLRNAEGRPFTPQSVRTWSERYLPPAQTRGRSSHPLKANQWYVPHLARHLDVSQQTIRVWIRQGRIESQTDPACGRRRIVTAAPARLKELMAYRTDHSPQSPDGRPNRTYRSKRTLTCFGGAL